MEEPVKTVDLDEVTVKAQKPKTGNTSKLFSNLGDFFRNLFRKKTKTIDEQESATVSGETQPKNNMAAGAILTSVTAAVGGIFNFLSKSKEVKIEEENTEQLKLQVEAAEDAALQATLQKKLDIQLTQLNAAREADRLKRIGIWVALLTAAGLLALVIVQVFRYKREKDKPQAPIIVQS